MQIRDTFIEELLTKAGFPNSPDNRAVIADRLTSMVQMQCSSWLATIAGQAEADRRRLIWETNSAVGASGTKACSYILGDMLLWAAVFPAQMPTEMLTSLPDHVAGIMLESVGDSGTFWDWVST
ncbi:hypothetical protein D9V37_16315 [Nocardioides mangrovicus]|uniref:Uncharacterized protein n=2 Tax=Nocardioides mangrovicus TaxID=2478913 RepID=A0A3L8NYD6_9ACTN|nr:hypothetical protein D9V37_16315 [Nocardioides mangrovicus]